MSVEQQSKMSSMFTARLVIAINENMRQIVRNIEQFLIPFLFENMIIDTC